MSFEKKYEASVYMGAMQKRGPDSGDHECKGPETGVCLMCWKNSKEAMWLDQREGAEVS